MRIAFFGLPLAAVLLARDGHEIVYAASPAAAGYRRLATRVAPGRTSLRPDTASVRTIETIRALRPDLIVSWFWAAKLPPSLLAVAPAIGVHPSLLPRHRGPDPYFWAIDGGDTVTGVTAHMLEDEYDTGAVLGRRELPIDPEWNAFQLARALDRPSLALLREVVKKVAEGRPPLPRPQDEAVATSAPSPRDEDLAIRWSWTAERIARRVRAAAPWPGAWTEIGGRIVTLVRTRPTSDYPRALEPGEAAARRDGVAIVRAGVDAIELLEGRSEEDAPLDRASLSAIVRNTAIESASRGAGG